MSVPAARRQRSFVLLGSRHFSWISCADAASIACSPLQPCRLDDLRRNYVLNKQNGLVIRPYKKVHLLLPIAADHPRGCGRCPSAAAAPPPQPTAIVAAGPPCRPT